MTETTAEQLRGTMAAAADDNDDLHMSRLRLVKALRSRRHFAFEVCRLHLRARKGLIIRPCSDGRACIERSTLNTKRYGSLSPIILPF